MYAIRSYYAGQVQVHEHRFTVGPRDHHVEDVRCPVRPCDVLTLAEALESRQEMSYNFV